MRHKLTIELISTFTCKRYQKAQQKLKNVLSKFDSTKVEYSEVNVLKQLDYAVSLGVMATPAIAVNGKLHFVSIPSEKQLQLELQKLLEEQNNV